MAETAHVLGQCPHCSNGIVIEQNWTPGGVNDYGGWVLKCDECGKSFHEHLGRDIQMSRVVSGAVVLATYDDEVEGNREDTLKRFGVFKKPRKTSKEVRKALKKANEQIKRASKRPTKKKAKP